MKKEIIALEIEIGHIRFQADFRFNNTMILAVFSGLSVVYEEVFLWSLGNHLAIWATGGQPEFLTQAFMHHRSHFKKMNEHTGRPAEILFSNIIEGKIWKDCSVVTKLDSFECGYERSIDQNCLGKILQPMVTEGLAQLNNHPMITAAANSWHRKKQSLVKDEMSEPERAILSTKSPGLFYRFCIN